MIPVLGTGGVPTLFFLISSPFQKGETLVSRI